MSVGLQSNFFEPATGPHPFKINNLPMTSNALLFVASTLRVLWQAWFATSAWGKALRVVPENRFSTGTVLATKDKANTGAIGHSFANVLL